MLFQTQEKTEERKKFSFERKKSEKTVPNARENCKLFQTQEKKNCELFRTQENFVLLAFSFFIGFLLRLKQFLFLHSEESFFFFFRPPKVVSVQIQSARRSQLGKKTILFFLFFSFFFKTS